MDGLNKIYFLTVLDTGSLSSRYASHCVSPAASPLSLPVATFLLCAHMVSYVCKHTPGVPLCALISSFYENTSQMRVGPTLKASF